MPTNTNYVGHIFEPILREVFANVFWLSLAFATLVLARTILISSGLPARVAICIAMLVALILGLGLVTIHELGHAGMAAALGWRVSMVVVGPIAIKMRPLRMIAGSPVMGGWFSGGTFVAPPLKNNSAIQNVAVSLAGPVINIAAGFLIVACARWQGARDIAHSPAEIFGQLSVFMGIWNLLPIRSRSGLCSDGRNIVDILCGTDLEARGSLQRMYDAIIRGGRPRDWDLAAFLIEKPIASSDAFESTLLYMYYFDSGDNANARLSLNRAINVAGSTDALMIADAFFSAFVEGDLARARECLKVVNVRRGAYFSMAEAVVRVCEGDVAGAARSVRLARRSLHKWPFATACDWGILDQIDARIRNTAMTGSTRFDNSMAECA